MCGGVCGGGLCVYCVCVVEVGVFMCVCAMCESTGQGGRRDMCRGVGASGLCVICVFAMCVGQVYACVVWVYTCLCVC